MPKVHSKMSESKQSPECQDLFKELKKTYDAFVTIYDLALKMAHAEGNVEAIREYGKLRWDYNLYREDREYKEAQTSWQEKCADRTGLTEWH